MSEVFLVAKFYRKRSGQISEEELVRYLLNRKNIDHLAPTSMRICYSGLRPRLGRFVLTVTAASACWPFSCPLIASALRLRWPTPDRGQNNSSGNRAFHRRLS
jgi:hypothetical protein